MDLKTAEAIVLDVIDLHDYDRIVTLLTRWQGKKRGVAKGSRRKYSRFAGQLQPLAKVRVTWMEKERQELVRLSSVELLRAAHQLDKDLEGLLLSAYLRDHMLEFAQEDEPGDHLYRLLDSTIEALVAGADRDLATRYFEAWVLRLAGVFPPPTHCPECDRPLPSRGAVLPALAEGLVCRDCGGRGAETVAPEVIEFLLRISQENLAKMAAKPPPSGILEQVDKLCAEVRRRFLQHELRSYTVIRETLEGLRGQEPATTDERE